MCHLHYLWTCQYIQKYSDKYQWLSCRKMQNVLVFKQNQTLATLKSDQATICLIWRIWGYQNSNNKKLTYSTTAVEILKSWQEKSKLRCLTCLSKSLPDEMYQTKTKVKKELLTVAWSIAKSYVKQHNFSIQHVVLRNILVKEEHLLEMLWYKVSDK